jgi:hypothetical protein
LLLNNCGLNSSIFINLDDNIGDGLTKLELLLERDWLPNLEGSLGSLILEESLNIGFPLIDDGSGIPVNLLESSIWFFFIFSSIFFNTSEVSWLFLSS